MRKKWNYRGRIFEKVGFKLEVKDRQSYGCADTWWSIMKGAISYFSRDRTRTVSGIVPAQNNVVSVRLRNIFCSRAGTCSAFSRSRWSHCISRDTSRSNFCGNAIILHLFVTYVFTRLYVMCFIDTRRFCSCTGRCCSSSDEEIHNL